MKKISNFNERCRGLEITLLKTENRLKSGYLEQKNPKSHGEGFNKVPEGLKKIEKLIDKLMRICTKTANLIIY